MITSVFKLGTTFSWMVIYATGPQYSFGVSVAMLMAIIRLGFQMVWGCDELMVECMVV